MPLSLPPVNDRADLDATLLSAATTLGLSAADVDDLFALAATL